MPETYGKRMRRDAQARKAAAREERRLARNQRREARAAGIDVDGEDELELLGPESVGAAVREIDSLLPPTEDGSPAESEGEARS
jgi:hypothetical protein